MINLDTNQLQHWLLQLFWPFVRIGACFMIAPVFGAAMVWSTALWFHHGLSSHPPLESEPLETSEREGARAVDGPLPDDDLVGLERRHGSVPEPA